MTLRLIRGVTTRSCQGQLGKGFTLRGSDPLWLGIPHRVTLELARSDTERQSISVVHAMTSIRGPTLQQGGLKRAGSFRSGTP